MKASQPEKRTRGPANSITTDELTVSLSILSLIFRLSVLLAGQVTKGIAAEYVVRVIHPLEVVDVFFRMPFRVLPITNG